MKKLVNCACWADFVNVAITVPILIPKRCTEPRRRIPAGSCPGTERESGLHEESGENRHQAQQNKQRRHFRDDDFRSARRRHQQLFYGAGSRSFTMAAEATSEPFRIKSSPKTPVTINQELIKPGL